MASTSTLPHPPGNRLALRSPTRQPTNAYTAGLPGPPRILIPPPTLHPEFRVMNGPSHMHRNLSLEHMIVSAESSVLPTTLQDWKYESRREAQQILPHVWLGPLAAAKNITFIAEQGITLLLAVRAHMTARANLLAAQLPGVKYQAIDVSGNQELISQFQRATDIIDDHYLSTLPNRGGMNTPIDGRELQSYQRAYLQTHHTMPPGGKTLLFCESGNERSAAVAAAYIMQHLGGTAVQAIQIVQSRRFCVCFDDSMKWLLSSYEPIWMARRQSYLNSKQNGQPGSRGISPARGDKKRRMDEREDDDDGDGGGGGAQVGSAAKSGHAPFSDDYTDGRRDEGDGGDTEMT